MRKLIISLVIILMFAFSLNKLNPVKEEEPVKKKRPIKKRCFICIRCIKGYHQYCSSSCNCKCVKDSFSPFTKHSNSTKTINKIIAKPKIIKQE